jgi:hypothetical protein
MLNTVRPAVRHATAVLALLAALAADTAATAAPPRSTPARPEATAKAEAPSNSAPTSTNPAGATPTTAAPNSTLPVSTASTSAAAASPPPVTAQPAPLLTGPQVIQLLDQTIDWYRSLAIQQQTANEPSDLLFLYDNRQTASRVLALVFEFARADADMLAKQPVAADSGAGADATSQSLSQTQDKFVAQSNAVQGELADTQHSLRVSWT